MGKQFKTIASDVLQSIIDLIYPNNPNCILCNSYDVDGICNNCLNSISFCEEVGDLCVGYYNGALKQLILNLKSKADFEAGQILVEFAEDKLKNIGEEYYLTFIPTTKSSLKKRGFNQCEYIAEELGRRTGHKVIDTIKRIKEVKEQKTLNKQERYDNLNQAFAAIDICRIEGRRFVLIDDVITTGSTLKEGIRVLRENGAEDIKTLTLAKSLI